MRVLDLFSGIGGFSLGLERTGGFKTVAFCEIEPFAQRVLAKHWPEVPIYDDVRMLTAQKLAADGLVGVDVICGGFPCQDISPSGKGAGLSGERSGLWSQYSRLIGELQPRYAVVENSSALKSRGRGLDQVLGDLASLGYDAEWHCIPASAVGAPHQRDRIWIVAYPTSSRRGQRIWSSGEPIRHSSWGTKFERLRSLRRGGEWTLEPSLGRLADGLPPRLVRPPLRAFGNAVVPSIPEMIGAAILEWEGGHIEKLEEMA